MENGADVEVRSSKSEATPLHEAAGEGHEVTVKTLLECVSIPALNHYLF